MLRHREFLFLEEAYARGQPTAYILLQGLLRHASIAAQSIVLLVHQDEEEEAESEEESSEAESSDTSSSSSDEELIDRALPVRQTGQHVDVGFEVNHHRVS